MKQITMSALLEQPSVGESPSTFSVTAYQASEEPLSKVDDAIVETWHGSLAALYQLG